ncbi:hypothetical protein B0H14DRAFT_2310141, partial [Mycena olivaceomarginata]
KFNNETVTIELKNGSIVRGTIIGTRKANDTHLKSPHETATPASLDALSIRGNNTQYFVLLDALLIDIVRV